MTRRFKPWLVLPVVAAVALGVAPASASAAPTAAVSAAGTAVGEPGSGRPPGGRTPELSVSSDLANRRFVAAGTRAYEVGTQAGRYLAMGFHTRGEMGGIWSAPLKLLDGIWFGVNGTWMPPASRFTSGWGYTRMEFPPTSGVSVQRTDVVPDGQRALLVGLTFSSSNGGTARSVDLAVDAHSELMSVYPWGETTPSQTVFNLPDSASVDRGRLVFRDRGTPPVTNAPSHDWAAVVGAAPGSPLKLIGTGTAPFTAVQNPSFRGPQDPPVVCGVSGPNTPPTPPVCDDTDYGKGAGGQLRYTVTVPATKAVTVWFTVAGSDRGLAAAQSEFASASGHPAARLAEKIASRSSLAARSVVSLPGDRQLQQAIDWGKQNLADLTQEAGGPQGQPLLVRETNAGTNYPAPAGAVASAQFIGAGYPDYPWLFATDGEYTAFAGVAVGQFAAVEDHLRALRDVSDVLNQRSGKVVHEVTTDGSVYFGANADPGNTDETVKFPSAVALVWRWTGDNRFRDEMYDYARRNLVYVTTQLDKDGDGWPEGAGNVERTGQGPEKLDNAAYLIRGELDFAEMARSKGDTAAAASWETKARALLAKFEGDWWFGGSNQGSPTPGSANAYADSLLDPGNIRIYQRYWTGVVPMEAELWAGDRTSPGLAAREHAIPALQLRETDCFTSSSGLVHTGSGATTNPNTPQPYPTVNCAGDDATSDQPDERDSFTLNTAVMAVGEGNYGRLAADQQQRYTDDLAKIMFTPDEMPGAMEEIAPSDPHPPYYGHSLGRLLTERASVMQAWGNYGTMWPVLHQQL
ncbi:MAG: glycogen debranching protein, partial [Kineosporiaceae bacterium]